MTPPFVVSSVPPVPVAPTVPTDLVELLARYDPDRAERVDRMARRPAPEGRRVALRVLVTGLAEVESRLERRRRHASRRAARTETELRRRRAELLTERQRVAEWPRQLRSDLGQLKLTATGELAGAIRWAREEIREYLIRADGPGRQRFAARFPAVLERLSERIGARMDELFAAFAPPADSPADSPAPRTPNRPGTAPPGRCDRSRLEDWLLPLVGASSGFGAARLALTWLGAVQASGLVTAEVVPALAVGLGVVAGWWLARSRRASLDRVRLGRWAAELLGELHAGWSAALAERLLDTERRLSPVAKRAAADRVAELTERVRELDQLAGRITAEWAVRADADTEALAELAKARAELARLLAEPEPLIGRAAGEPAG